MALIIDKIKVSKHAQERLAERGVPWPHRLTLHRMSDAEANMAEEQFQTDNPNHTFKGKAFRNGTDVIYATARDNSGKQPVYILQSLKNRRYKLVTCWWIDTPVNIPKPARVTALAIVNKAAQDQYGIHPEYVFNGGTSWFCEWICKMIHPSGETATGRGSRKSGAKADCCENYLKQQQLIDQ